MEMDQLLERLKVLEDAEAERNQQAELSGFMDKFGDQFSGNQDMGLALLNEFKDRGVDISEVTGEAVTGVLDQVRMEAQALLDMLKQKTNEVAALTDKINNIEESVQTVAAPTADVQSGAAMEPPPPPGEDMPPAPMPEGGAPAPIPGGDMPPPPMPEGGDMGGFDPTGMPPAEPMPPAPMDQGMPPAEPMPTAPMVSDANLKRICRLMDARGKARKQAKNNWKPSASIIAGARSM